ncbi:MAG: KOW domain-containing RNA-binding protein [Alicyclobacillaceae bacterium]|nr:KOW domain-containing RNA-binding protein [Alicyclobacillaceae bacterium]
MSRRPTLPDVGRIVEITRGRDRGSFAVVIGHDADRFVLVADGDKRKAEKPKRKNALHVRNTAWIAEEVVDELQRGGKVTNARLRHALRVYQQHLADRMSGEASEEGGGPDGERGRD